MKHFNRKCLNLILVWFLSLGLAFVGMGVNAFSQEEKISKPGKYEGYSKPIYEEWMRISQYVTVRDGTKLAVDIYRPTINGAPVSEPLPLIWAHTRYHRADFRKDGTIFSLIDQPWLQKILKHGYIVAAVDVRGGGASFGTRRGVFTLEEAQDAYDIIDWFAQQPWCDGNIGMYGGSYLGITQYIAAGMGSPYLKAIVPVVAMFDLYSFAYPGGVYQDDFIQNWSDFVKKLDIDIPTPPVDEDPQSIMAKEAMEMHKVNVFLGEVAPIIRFRDSQIPGETTMVHLEWSPNRYLKGINDKGSHTAVYTIAGWYDLWPRDALTWFNNLKNPQKIIILPRSHSGTGEGWRNSVGPLVGFDFKFDLTAEHLRWYDYWLKGIDNGIMNEPPISYFTIGAPEDKAWKEADTWPLTQAEQMLFYFREGPSRSIESVNDGLLERIPPDNSSGEGTYMVDYSTTSGKETRWTDGMGIGFNYGDMAVNDAKGLTYTTEPLEDNMEVTGHPVVTLWVSSTADDGDFFVYLEEVDQDGYSHYITEGVLRASHRKLSEPPFEYMGLPYHRSFEEDIEPMREGRPVKLVFDLHPTSNIFNIGNRIRITMTCADQNNFQTPELSPPPTVILHRSSSYASHVALPVVTAGVEVVSVQENLVLMVVIILVVIMAVIFLTYFLRARLKK